ncbi:homeobox-leucine zipper protein ROC2-like [Diospyros lotus]|uniref:homeobox-leucine zipper protein ROC2-like n=1 Tax=Diospyros lotus TaxID=55363 RepID=UPI0022569569|nr:homeobox-leucine zipper protein ROC2-like [Diospyros lotus]
MVKPHPDRDPLLGSSLASFFKNNPRLDYKKRRELGSRLGLTPMQIKFWFQNKRSHMKIQKAKTENDQFHFQSEELAFEIRRLKDMIKNSYCSSCGRPTGLAEMLDDSARMREEARGLSLGNTSIDPERFIMQQSEAQPIIMPCIGLPEQVKKQLILGIAVSAMEELIKMAYIGTPLWTTSTSSNACFLNEEEYHMMFPQANRTMPTGFKCESSRETALIMINPLKLVEILMDVFQWATVFAAIVARAITHDVVAPRVAGSYNGSLQVLTAEFQVPSPLSPSREAYFARYCKQLEDGGWAVVDVSLDSLCPLPLVSSRRRPSGCLIHEMPNGYSKVTWVEHVDADDRGVHNMYRAFVNSGLAFGAKSWISILDRQCERLASVMAPPFPTTSSETIEGRKSMLNLAERIVTSFCGSMNASRGHTWTTLFGKGDDDVRIMIRNTEAHSGSPLGVVLNAAISFKLPVHPNIVFDFLRSKDTRTQWDVLSHGGELQELAYVANGGDTGNQVSLFRVITVGDTTKNMFILQESIIGPTGCFVVYARLDVVTINKVLSGVDSTLVEILPSGFAIVPDGNIESGQLGCGSVVTAQFQILVDTSPTTRLYLDSVTTINTFVTATVNKIKDAMGGSSSAAAAWNI